MAFLKITFSDNLLISNTLNIDENNHNMIYPSDDENHIDNLFITTFNCTKFKCSYITNHSNCNIPNIGYINTVNSFADLKEICKNNSDTIVERDQIAVKTYKLDTIDGYDLSADYYTNTFHDDIVHNIIINYTNQDNIVNNINFEKIKYNVLKLCNYVYNTHKNLFSFCEYKKRKSRTKKKKMYVTTGNTFISILASLNIVGKKGYLHVDNGRLIIKNYNDNFVFCVNDNIHCINAVYDIIIIENKTVIVTDCTYYNDYYLDKIDINNRIKYVNNFIDVLNEINGLKFDSDKLSDKLEKIQNSIDDKTRYSFFSNHYYFIKDNNDNYNEIIDNINKYNFLNGIRFYHSKNIFIYYLSNKINIDVQIRVVISDKIMYNEKMYVRAYLFVTYINENNYKLPSRFNLNNKTNSVYFPIESNNYIYAKNKDKVKNKSIVSITYNNDTNIPECFRWIIVSVRQDKTKSCSYGNLSSVAKTKLGIIKYNSEQVTLENRFSDQEIEEMEEMENEYNDQDENHGGAQAAQCGAQAAQCGAEEEIYLDCIESSAQASEYNDHDVVD
jgi:hypothetical protein